MFLLEQENAVRYIYIFHNFVGALAFLSKVLNPPFFMMLAMKLLQLEKNIQQERMKSKIIFYVKILKVKIQNTFRSCKEMDLVFSKILGHFEGCG